MRSYSKVPCSLTSILIHYKINKVSFSTGNMYVYSSIDGLIKYNVSVPSLYFDAFLGVLHVNYVSLRSHVTCLSLSKGSFSLSLTKHSRNWNSPCNFSFRRHSASTQTVCFISLNTSFPLSFRLPYLLLDVRFWCLLQG